MMPIYLPKPVRDNVLECVEKDNAHKMLSEEQVELTFVIIP
jgi:hypothetical protein